MKEIDLEKETVQENGVISKPHRHKILETKCLSSSHKAYVEGVIDGVCECGNCKVKVRQLRYHKGAYIGDTSHHDYVLDREEIIEIKHTLI